MNLQLRADFVHVTNKGRPNGMAFDGSSPSRAQDFTDLSLYRMLINDKSFSGFDACPSSPKRSVQ